MVAQGPSAPPRAPSVVAGRQRDAAANVFIEPRVGYRMLREETALTQPPESL